MHEHDYQHLYHTVLGSYIDKEQTLTFRHFLEQLYHIFVESYINQEHMLLRNFLTAGLHIFLVLR